MRGMGAPRAGDRYGDVARSLMGREGNDGRCYLPPRVPPPFAFPIVGLPDLEPEEGAPAPVRCRLVFADEALVSSLERADLHGRPERPGDGHPPSLRLVRAGGKKPTSAVQIATCRWCVARKSRGRRSGRWCLFLALCQRETPQDPRQEPCRRDFLWSLRTKLGS